jgi:hypothetical protein
MAPQTSTRGVPGSQFRSVRPTESIEADVYQTQEEKKYTEYTLTCIRELHVLRIKTVYVRSALYMIY